MDAKRWFLVHGYQTSGRIWRLTQAALDAAQYRTIAISNRGAGDSDRGQMEADYTVQAFARDLRQAITCPGRAGLYPGWAIPWAAPRWHNSLCSMPIC